MFDFKKFLREGGIEKYLLEAQFGNDIDSRYEYIRPLMSRLPDSARTEMLIDGMEEARAEDDKQAFDFYFVEAMKELGLEDELIEPNDDITPPGPEDMPGAKVPPFITDKEFQMRANAFALEEADSLINPEAEEIEDDDLAAAADYFDSLAENDDVLDEILDEVEGEVQSEAMSDQLKINKLLQAANTIEDSLNDVNLELTDDQIDKFTEMILDLRAKAKAKLTNEGFGDQVGAAVSGIGKGISSVLSILIGGVVAIGVLIFSGAIAAASGILAVLGIAGVGLIRAVEQFVVIPKINSTLKRLSEDEEVMAIAMKPSASGLRKIADEKLTRGERLVVGDWIKKNVTRSMLGVNRRYKGGKYVATKSKRGPGLGKYDYMGLTEE